MLSPMVSKIGLNIEKPLFFNLHPQFTKFWPQIQDKPGKNNPLFPCGFTNPLQVGGFSSSFGHKFVKNPWYSRSNLRK